MNYTEFSKELVEEFSQFFPEFYFGDIDTGYNKIEDMLCTKIDTFTELQWNAILSRNYDMLFQQGIPHMNWNTDRSSLARTLLEKYKARPICTWDETWQHCYKYCIKTKEGVILEIIKEEPVSFSTGRFQYYIHIATEYTPAPEYRAVILALDSDTKAHIIKQMMGTLTQCEVWADEQTKNSNHVSKIIKI